MALARLKDIQNQNAGADEVVSVGFDTGEGVTVDFDPTAFGAIPLDEPDVATPAGAASDVRVDFDPAQFGAIPIQAPTAPDFIDKIGASLGERGEQVGETIDELFSGDVTFPEAALQVIGKGVAGSASDIIAQSIASGAGTAADIFTFLAPETAEDIKEQFTELVGSDLAQTAIGALESGVEAYTEFAEDNPRTAKNLESLILIGSFAVPAKGIRLPNKQVIPTAGLSRKADKIIEAADPAARKQAAMIDVTAPKPTDAIRRERLARTDADGTYNPTAREFEIADEVGKVKGVKASGNLPFINNTLVKNNALVRAEIKKEADQLTKKLKNAPSSAISGAQIATTRAAVQAALKEAPLLVGDAAKTGQRFMNKAAKLVRDNPKTAAGMHNARKAFDRWFTSQRSATFDAGQINAMNTAWKEIRNGMNDLIDVNAPNASVRESLKKQNLLIEGAENITAKAANEATSTIGRMASEIFSDRGLRRIAASSVISAALDSAVGGFFTVGNVILRTPGASKSLATALRAIDKGIATASNPAQVQKLKGMRQTTLEILRNTQEGTNAQSKARKKTQK